MQFMSHSYASKKLLGGSGDGAAFVEGAILHAALVHASDDVKVALVAPRGGPRVGNGPVLHKRVSNDSSTRAMNQTLVVFSSP